MGVIYEAVSPRLGTVVALKVLAPELSADDVFRTRFLKESRIAASLNHPNVLPIFDTGAADDLLYIAMRYVEGSDLHAVLKVQGRLTPMQALSLIQQVARALDAAHRHGLVHRDVKPANILIERGADDEPDHVYLADFGVTKHASSTSGLGVGTVRGDDRLHGPGADSIPTRRWPRGRVLAWLRALRMSHR
jgi:serine/threonine protein kinase